MSKRTTTAGAPRPRRDPRRLSEERLGHSPFPRRTFFDAAATNRHNEKHFLYSTQQDADAAIMPDLETTRNRVRREFWNNSYAYGIGQTFSNDTVGTGPLIQMLVNGIEQEEMERRFEEWALICDAAGHDTFARMLWIAVMQFLTSGEGLFVFVPADRQSRQAKYPVKLRLLMVEPDRLITPWGMAESPNLRNGIETNDYGEPLFYYILKQHPGSAVNYKDPMAFDKVPASKVIHLFLKERPGQSRGFPWLTAALPLFAYLRRYTLAVVDAAEKAADMAVTLEAFGNDVTPVQYAPLDEVSFERGMMTTLPLGWRANQMKPEQPTNSYRDFKHEIINEIARCVNMSFNVAAGNSSDYNYASGRLDWQTYFRAIQLIQEWLSIALCDRVIAEWRAEAELVPGYLKRSLPPTANLYTAYSWDGPEHVDPQKEANARDTNLRNFSTTLKREYARMRLNWRVEIAQAAEEKKVLKAAGLKMEEAGARLRKSAQPEDDEEEPPKKKGESRGKKAT